MAAFDKILKNQKSPAADLPIKELGVTLPASGQVSFHPNEFTLLATDAVIAELTPHINSGDVVVNDGINDLSIAEGIDYLRYPHFARSSRFENMYFFFELRFYDQMIP